MSAEPNFFEDIQETPKPISGTVPDFFSDISQAVPQETQRKNIWDSFGQGLAYQMKSGGPAGAPALSPEQAKKVGVETGTMLAVGEAFAPLRALALTSKFAPGMLESLARLTQAGATGIAVPSVESLVETGELPSKEELLKEGAIWMGIDAAVQLLHAGTAATRTINALASENNISRREVIRRIWAGAKNYYGWAEPEIDPNTGAAIVMPEQIEAMENLVKKNPEVIQGEVLATIEEPTPEAPDFFEPAPEKKLPEVAPAAKTKPITPQHKIEYQPYQISNTGQQKQDVEGNVYYVGDSRVLAVRKLDAPDREGNKFIVDHPNSGLMLAGAQTKTEANDIAKWALDNAITDINRFASDDPKIIAQGIDRDKFSQYLKQLKEEKRAKKLKPEPREAQERKTLPAEELEREKAEAVGAKPTPQADFSNRKLAEQKAFILDKVNDAIENPTNREQITIKVPDDGVFRVNNNPENLEGFKKRVQKQWPGKPVKAAPSPTKGAVDFFAPQLTEQQIRNRKIAAARAEKIQKQRAIETEQRKERAERERRVAFKALGIEKQSEAVKEADEIIPQNEDTQQAEVLEEESLDPETARRMQAFAEMRLLKDEISTKLKGVWSRVDVEAPFKAVGASKTGRAVKLFYDTKNAYLEEARGLIKKLDTLGLTKEQRWDAFLAAETENVPADPQIAAGRQIFRDYFDSSFAKYESEGGLSLPWPGSAIARLKQRIVDLQTKLTAPNIVKHALGQVEKEIADIRKEIAILRKLKYVPKTVPLITQALADALSEIDPKSGSRLAIHAHRIRKSGALADWIKEEPLIKEVLDPLDFVRDYAQRKGGDIALLRIIKSAESEGLASKGEKLGFKMDPIKFPALAGYNVHPALFEHLTNLANPIPFNTYDKISRWAKGTIVFDPSYFIGVLLPYFRTLIQFPATLAKLPKYWRKAMTDFLDATPAYVEAIENGLASTPFPEAGDFQTWVEKAKMGPASPIELMANTLLTKDGLKHLGNQIGNFTWTIERIGRLAYYNMLLDKGFSVADAAKLAAENFLDYNKLPAKTRRWMSRIFFAPAFQMLSLINDSLLLYSPAKLAKELITDPKAFKSAKVNKERISLLIGTAIVLIGIEEMYRRFGFKRDEFGTRYTAEFIDENGKAKELVIVPSHPLNVSLRWINTFWRGFGPGESLPLQKIWGRASGQLGPVPSFIVEVTNNKNREGKQIWDPVGDNALTAMKKVSLFALGKIEPFIVSKFHTPEQRKAAKEKMRDAFGYLDCVLDSIEFFYDRKPEYERDEAKIKYLRGKLSHLKREGDLDEATEERYHKAIEAIREKE